MIQRRVIVVRIYDAGDHGEDVEKLIAEKIPEGWYPVEVSASCGMAGTDDYSTAQELVAVIIEKPMSMVQYEEELRELEIYSRAFTRLATVRRLAPTEKFLEEADRIIDETKRMVEKKCICPQGCDCENYEAGLVSNHCPVHNEYPRPYEGCPAEIHGFDEEEL